MKSHTKPPQERSEDALRHEYSELLQCFRHYSAVRYAVLTLFYSVTGALVAALTSGSQISPLVIDLAPYLGLITCATLGVMAYHVELLLLYYVDLGRELEHALGGYRLISGRPTKPRMRPRHIVKVNVTVIGLSWLAVILNRAGLF